MVGDTNLRHSRKSATGFLKRFYCLLLALNRHETKSHLVFQKQNSLHYPFFSEKMLTFIAIKYVIVKCFMLEMKFFKYLEFEAELIFVLHFTQITN